jgi:hypothetical protein
MGKPVQIDSEELALYRAGHGMLEKLYADPEEGIGFKRLIKKKFPLAQVPDLEAVGAAEKMFRTITDRLDKQDDERKKEREEFQVKDLQGRFDRVAKDHGLTEEGQKKLIGIMRDRNIGNPEDAVVIFEKDLPKATKASKPFSSRMSFITADGDKDADYHKLMTDPDAFMVDGMMASLAEMKKD